MGLVTPCVDYRRIVWLESRRAFDYVEQQQLRVYARILSLPTPKVQWTETNRLNNFNARSMAPLSQGLHKYLRGGDTPIGRCEYPLQIHRRRDLLHPLLISLIYSLFPMLFCHFRTTITDETFQWDPLFLQLLFKRPKPIYKCSIPSAGHSLRPLAKRSSQRINHWLLVCS